MLIILSYNLKKKTIAVKKYEYLQNFNEMPATPVDIEPVGSMPLCYILSSTPLSHTALEYNLRSLRKPYKLLKIL